ncbi:serine hydrolase domain-containing protein [Nocardiopsis suaedae]|uniref:Serine hydrolase n=1 Tax=Nocardiopsis suaedae TaxID=3018444 RepID=A0ABT4TGI0_9ACTN|nr:serine hydrolase domain-containing protein [Nocardiopsis suaedae]MDA2803804.1 serine hydrolase [Nocardiopsis suaedae]
MAAAIGAYLLFPVTPPVERNVSGDEEIAEAVLAELPRGSAVGVSVLLEEDGQARSAQLGTRGGGEPVGEGTRFETGSLQKVVTARLLAQMVEDGDVELDTTLGEIWPDVDFADQAVADTTLESLATHTSGLPPLPFGWDPGLTRSILPTNFFGTDPYGGTGSPLQAAASAEDSGAAPDSPQVYSNFGFALLGESLGEAAGADYRTAVTERVLEPLGMDDTVVAGPGDGPPEDAALPYRAASSPAVQWSGGSYAPAGLGTWSTPEDLNRFLAAARDSEDPVTRLTHEPREVEGVPGEEEFDGRSGLAWVLWNVEGTEVAWHNGATSGTVTFAAHTGDGRSVVVMADSAKVPAERIGFGLLEMDSTPFADDGGGGVAAYWSAGVGVFLAVLVPLITLVRIVRGRLQRVRLARVNTVAESAVSVAAWAWAFVLGDWGTVPPAVWALGGGLVAASLVTAGFRWPATGGSGAAPARWYSWIMPVVNVAFAVLVLWGTATAVGQMP